MSLPHQARVVIDPSIRHRAGSALPLSHDVIPVVLMVSDAAFIIALSVAAGVSYHLIALGGIGDLAQHAGCGVAAAAFFTVWAEARGLYRPANLRRLKSGAREAAFVWTMVFFCLTTVAFVLKIGDVFSRGAIIIFLLSGLIVMPGLRLVYARAFSYFTSSGALAKRIVLLGEADQLTGKDVIRSIGQHGYSISGAFALPTLDHDARNISEDAAEQIRDAMRHVRERGVDEIFLAIPWIHACFIERVAAELRALPTPVKLLPDRTIHRFLEYPIFEIGALKAVGMQKAPLSLAQRAGKRAMDMTLAALGLVVLAPAFILIAFAIRRDSAGPAFFQQVRVGFNGRPFRIYKFRTMTTLDDGPVIRQARRGDERVTQVGRLLRRFSLDELPQLVNVLRGEMSLVGPRPHALAHDNEYDKLIARYAIRQKMRPGITGWAQVHGCRGETPEVHSMKRRVEHDLWYIDYWSFWVDVRILVMTVVQMLRARNAY